MLSVCEPGKAYGRFARPERIVAPARIFEELAPRYLPSLAEVEEAARVAMAALYLPGAPRGFDPPRREWPEVLRAIRSEGIGLTSLAGMLDRRGFAEAGLALESPGLLGWAERHVNGGRVLTGACAHFPEGWRRKLGGSCPPAVWARSRCWDGKYVAVVGSR